MFNIITIQLVSISHQEKHVKRKKMEGDNQTRYFKSLNVVSELLNDWWPLLYVSLVLQCNLGDMACKVKSIKWLGLGVSQTGRIPKISLYPYIPVALVTNLPSNYLFLKLALMKALTNKHTLLSLLSITLIIWSG